MGGAAGGIDGGDVLLVALMKHGQAMGSGYAGVGVSRVGVFREDAALPLARLSGF